MPGLHPVGSGLNMGQAETCMQHLHGSACVILSHMQLAAAAGIHSELLWH